ncbi:MAG TPA: ATP cone domain-containing protein [Candidatus Paceibacterota bacterium]|nr:ATP cone domain-containing protein [Candidatus Paceibacterota bacterium]HOL54213.1 ATP cone domain-containing protein [Candidatus Paceibacterota bacterium]HON22046.1 ATP cone domain-containing protein [Candidatus Paceibacterota bacterium]HPP17105.1 ATP cone domain-containing protein [Candidatus Paceibacterota bacterium]HRU33706.1 ATP cone domain-containing protein [Candidatus Paceibacterota bacterium]
MARFVIKKTGEKEPFDPTKVEDSIRAAAADANLTPERTESVVNRVAAVIIEMATKREEIATSEIRARILKELEVLEPSVAEAWKKFEQEHNKTA